MPFGNVIVTFTGSFLPGVVKSGMFSTLLVAPSGTLICFKISSGVNLAVVTGVSISLIGVTFTGTSTVITFPFGNVTVTFTGSFLPGVVKSGMFSTLVVAPSGTLICFKISSGVNLAVVTGVSISLIGVTFTGTSTVITFPFGNVTVTFTGSFLPGVVKSGMFSTLVVAPSGTLICFKISSGVNLAVVTGVSISLTGVTVTGTSTVTTLPFGNVIVTFTGSFLPGVVKSGKSPTLAFPPSGTLICFKISSGVNFSVVTGVSISLTGVTVTGTSTV